MISAKASHAADLLQQKLEFANSAIPYLNKVVGEIVSQADEHRSIRQRLEQLDVHRQLTGGDELYSSELKAVELMADELCGRIKNCYRELDQIEGITFSESQPDTIEFPLEVEKGIVHLSWRLGEESIGYWHWSDESKDSRRRIELLVVPTLESLEH